VAAGRLHWLYISENPQPSELRLASPREELARELEMFEMCCGL
jgi:hypothetical protein